MKIRHILVASTVLTVAPLSAFQEHVSRRSLTPEGLAFGGYDPVSCFPAGGMTPTPGVEAFEVVVETARYRFASAEHKRWFEAEPARYEPAYGGFDAATIFAGAVKASDPRQFKLRGARLFVFAQPAGAASFDGERAAAADEAWKKLCGESPRGLVIDDARVGLKWNLGKEALALEGFDPVSYFPEGGGAPVKGDRKFETLLDGARYRFASDAHRDWFAAEPARYRPKYGGWCAYAMVDGDDVEVDPKSFLIENGRLLLFYKGFLADTRAKWIPKAKEFGPKADAQWAKHR